MDGNSCGDDDEEDAEEPVGRDEDSAVEEGDPNQGDGDDFDMKRD